MPKTTTDNQVGTSPPSRSLRPRKAMTVAVPARRVVRCKSTVERYSANEERSPFGSDKTDKTMSTLIETNDHLAIHLIEIMAQTTKMEQKYIAVLEKLYLKGLENNRLKEQTNQTISEIAKHKEQIKISNEANNCNDLLQFDC